MNTTSPILSQLSLTPLTATCDLAHSLLSIELACREMDQPTMGSSVSALGRPSMTDVTNPDADLKWENCDAAQHQNQTLKRRKLHRRATDPAKI